MHAQTVLTAAFAALVAAAPTLDDRAEKYHGVSLYVNVAPLGKTPVLEPAPIEINKLTSLHGTKATELLFDRGVHINVEINTIECRAYSDKAGVVPLTPAFTAKHPAKLGYKPVEVGSILCYVAEKA